jgi:hypothetical protein
MVRVDRRRTRTDLRQGRNAGSAYARIRAKNGRSTPTATHMRKATLKGKCCAAIFFEDLLKGNILAFGIF